MFLPDEVEMMMANDREKQFLSSLLIRRKMMQKNVNLVERFDSFVAFTATTSTRSLKISG